MRARTPSLAPDEQPHDVTIYIVLNDFGQLGRAYVETDEAAADEQTVINNISDGEYSNPVRVVAFNTAEGLSRDVTEDIARALLEREASEADLSESAKKFVERVLDTALLWLGALPEPVTIASVRAHGVRQLLVYCLGKREGDWPCHHSGMLPVDRFQAEEVLSDIERRCRCITCGWRRADLRPD